MKATTYSLRYIIKGNDSPLTFHNFVAQEVFVLQNQSLPSGANGESAARPAEGGQKQEPGHVQVILPVLEKLKRRRSVGKRLVVSSSNLLTFSLRATLPKILLFNFHLEIDYAVK